ncbi:MULTISPECIES: helix-turn-helix domain-containing protein [Staphylococcus]|nr:MULTISPECIES: helix-turn-helix transcriptional regulator [Staphylococcus]MDU0462082.1 helix-turn-helix transcriptional regulator [Staphylococcus ureilyticus]
MIQSKLSVLMAERGLKISDLYEETGISKTTLMALAENSGKGVQFDTIDKLCNYLDITPCEFFDYAPYMINIDDADFSSGSEEFNNISITLKKQFYKRTFYISIYVFDATEKFIILPTDDKNIDFYVRVDLEGSDSYNNEDFYSFLSDLSVNFKTNLINEILNRSIDKLYQNIGKKLSNEKGYLSKNDNILIHLFSDTKFDMLKKITLK